MIGNESLDQGTTKGRSPSKNLRSDDIVGPDSSIFSRQQSETPGLNQSLESNYAVDDRGLSQGLDVLFQMVDIAEYNRNQVSYGELTGFTACDIEH